MPLDLPSDDLLARCRENEGCARLLAIEPPANLSRSDRDEFIYWRTTLAIAGVGTRPPGGWIAYRGPFPTGELEDAVRLLHPEIVPHAECGLSLDVPSPRRPIIHFETGRSAVTIGMEVYQGENRAVSHIWLEFGELFGNGYDCSFLGEPGEVEASWCTLNPIMP